jgi:hypothetical protein
MNAGIALSTFAGGGALVCFAGTFVAIFGLSLFAVLVAMTSFS